MYVKKVNSISLPVTIIFFPMSVAEWATGSGMELCGRPFPFPDNLFSGIFP